MLCILKFRTSATVLSNYKTVETAAWIFIEIIFSLETLLFQREFKVNFDQYL